jgi:CBS domain containing-hemolysin-like protein
MLVCMPGDCPVRPRRLKRFENEELPGASTAIFLQRNIDDFFAAVQIGITFIATLSSALAGAFSGELFAPLIGAIGVSPASAWGKLLALLGVTVTISYLSSYGELVLSLWPAVTS